jgi:hypothetical protein
MNPETEYRQLVESKGISLQSRYGIGMRDIALSREDAMLAVNLLQRASIPILGGDVYFKKTTGIESAYANWHSDPTDGEDRANFVTRSCREALNYIAGFPSAEAVPIFVLVIDA